MPAAYDTIGINYANLRQPDPRIEAAIGTTAEVRTLESKNHRQQNMNKLTSWPDTIT